MKDKYYEQAVTCVKDTVLPAQIILIRVLGAVFAVAGCALAVSGF